MHIGTARTALFNWLVARATSGRFLLRMDDTDAARNMPEAEQPIFDGLTWLGLDWDEFHRQSDRIDIYRTCAGRLQADGVDRRERERGAQAEPQRPPLRCAAKHGVLGR